MKAITLFLLLIVVSHFAVPGLAQSEPVDSDIFFRDVSRPPQRPDNSAKIEAFLKQMTVEEKVGRMTQLTIDMVTTGDDQNVKIDEAKHEKAIVKYGVGSILNVMIGGQSAKFTLQ